MARKTTKPKTQAAVRKEVLAAERSEAQANLDAQQQQRDADRARGPERSPTQSYSVFDPDTGRFICSVSRAPEHLGHYRGVVFAGKSSEAFWLDPDADPAHGIAPVERPVLVERGTQLSVKADGKDSVHLAMPDGAVVTPVSLPVETDGRSRFAEKGAGFTFRTTVPGTYRFSIRSAWPYQDQVFEIVADV